MGEIMASKREKKSRPKSKKSEPSLELYINYINDNGNRVEEKVEDETRSEQIGRYWKSWDKYASPEQRAARDRFWELVITRTLNEIEQEEASKKATQDPPSL